VKERLEDEKDEIRRQAEVEAAREAERQLEEFRASQGPAILEEATANLRKTKFRSLVEQEKATLRARALEDLRAVAVQTAAGEFANEDPRVDKEYNKARAAEIRKITKRTRLLDLTSLQSDDLLEVVFVKKGNGNESYTEGDGWGNSYERTDLVTRRITLRMTDCNTGSALIEEDSWLNDKTKTERSLAPMTPVRGVCVNPVDHQTVPGVYKAAPLYLLRNGTDVMGSDHEVWYATLNDYKALS
jgi:hypothetical protein